MSFLKIAILMFSTLLSGLFADKKESTMRPDNEATGTKSLYDFKMKALIGDEKVDLSQYKGKKVVLINVASKCGYTPQYADWQAFHEKYGKDIVVLGFPANNFGGQEPGSDEQIATFCQKNYGVTFQMFDKIDVTGKLQHPLYRWLSTKDLNGWNDKAPTWNFCKYVVNEQGQLTNFFASGVKPTDAEFKKAIGL
jgi:glutathione peroxidase